MRTTKRFTPTLLDRFLRQGRGRGTFDNYSPWHQVTRGDPASQGRSHLLHWGQRLRHLLSDEEWGAQLFGLMLEGLADSMEQAPLSLEDAPHPLSSYTLNGTGGTFGGTIDLAEELQIKHPSLSVNGQSKAWTMTTDLLLTLQDTEEQWSMLAVAVKPKGWKERERTVELLRLEEAYWARRQIPWLLVTPEVCTRSSVLTLRRICAWALTEPVDAEHRALAAAIAMEGPSVSVIQILERLQRYTPSLHAAQCALWQSVWSGCLPVDLNRGWRPQEPLQVLTPKAFLAQNPIASRRSAWI